MIELHPGTSVSTLRRISSDTVFRVFATVSTLAIIADLAVIVSVLVAASGAHSSSLVWAALGWLACARGVAPWWLRSPVGRQLASVGRLRGIAVAMGLYVLAALTVAVLAQSVEVVVMLAPIFLGLAVAVRSAMGPGWGTAELPPQDRAPARQLAALFAAASASGTTAVIFVLAAVVTSISDTPSTTAAQIAGLLALLMAAAGATVTLVAAKNKVVVQEFDPADLPEDGLKVLREAGANGPRTAVAMTALVAFLVAGLPLTAAAMWGAQHGAWGVPAGGLLAVAGLVLGWAAHRHYHPSLDNTWLLVAAAAPAVMMVAALLQPWLALDVLMVLAAATLTGWVASSAARVVPLEPASATIAPYGKVSVLVLSAVALLVSVAGLSANYSGAVAWAVVAMALVTLIVLWGKGDDASGEDFFDASTAESDVFEKDDVKKTLSIDDITLPPLDDEDSGATQDHDDSDSAPRLTALGAGEQAADRASGGDTDVAPSGEVRSWLTGGIPTVPTAEDSQRGAVHSNDDAEVSSDLAVADAAQGQHPAAVATQTNVPAVGSVAGTHIDLDRPAVGPHSRFIVIEGGDGSGKSTVVTELHKALSEAYDEEVVVTRQPGGTTEGRRVRDLLLGANQWSHRAEVLLFAADRAHHAETLIEPALAAGKFVLCDRYIDSSIAYQGAGRDLDPKDVEDISLWATQGLRPDITVLLDVDPEVAAARRGKDTTRTGDDRIEGEALAFHQAVRAGFLERAADDPEHYIVVDASQTQDDVVAEVVDCVLSLLRDHSAATVDDVAADTEAVLPGTDLDRTADAAGTVDDDGALPEGVQDTTFDAVVVSDSVEQPDADLEPGSIEVAVDDAAPDAQVVSTALREEDEVSTAPVDVVPADQDGEGRTESDSDSIDDVADAAETANAEADETAIAEADETAIAEADETAIAAQGDGEQRTSSDDVADDHLAGDRESGDEEVSESPEAEEVDPVVEEVLDELAAVDSPLEGKGTPDEAGTSLFGVEAFTSDGDDELLPEEYAGTEPDADSELTGSDARDAGDNAADAADTDHSGTDSTDHAAADKLAVSAEHADQGVDGGRVDLDDEIFAEVEPDPAWDLTPARGAEDIAAPSLDAAAEDSHESAGNDDAARATLQDRPLESAAETEEAASGDDLTAAQPADDIDTAAAERGSDEVRVVGEDLGDEVLSSVAKDSLEDFEPELRCERRVDSDDLDDETRSLDAGAQPGAVEAPSGEDTPALGDDAPNGEQRPYTAAQDDPYDAAERSVAEYRLDAEMLEEAQFGVVADASEGPAIADLPVDTAAVSARDHVGASEGDATPDLEDGHEAQDMLADEDTRAISSSGQGAAVAAGDDGDVPHDHVSNPLPFVDPAESWFGAPVASGVETAAYADGFTSENDAPDDFAPVVDTPRDAGQVGYHHVGADDDAQDPADLKSRPTQTPSYDSGEVPTVAPGAPGAPGEVPGADDGTGAAAAWFEPAAHGYSPDFVTRELPTRQEPVPEDDIDLVDVRPEEWALDRLTFEEVWGETPTALARSHSSEHRSPQASRSYEGAADSRTTEFEHTAELPRHWSFDSGDDDAEASQHTTGLAHFVRTGDLDPDVALAHDPLSPDVPQRGTTAEHTGKWGKFRRRRRDEPTGTMPAVPPAGSAEHPAPSQHDVGGSVPPTPAYGVQEVPASNEPRRSRRAHFMRVERERRAQRDQGEDDLQNWFFEDRFKNQ